MDFLTVVIIAFSAITVLAGIFTAYFGTGKSRTVGLILLLIGVVIGAVWIFLCGYSDVDIFKDVYLKDVFLTALVNFAGILVGAIVGVGLFLIAVMKS